MDASGFGSDWHLACINRPRHAEFCVHPGISFKFDMYLTVLGINHRTAPVEVRGQVAFPPEQLARALAELTALEGMHEAVILSTCNRTEVYYTRDDTSFDTIARWLCRFHNLDQDSLQPHFYSYHEADAVRHVLRVAAGLDSMILGEPQILGQMKDCYQQAIQAVANGYADAARLIECALETHLSLRYHLVS